ncbi:haloacid dehalogenase [Erysipelothrix larvae]|uniref:Haloacid dehalogenase n=1 Tax=Erysipelothrix larvae TaxID=1514105 RepID=A0A0X8GYU6_9FIRM|nr:Cof-type HAD-IIB family hydrolase [Erysipelothrix larvae]AMC92951.1 haloacid dehalogenase [Erysipelothrix larvae]
MDIKNIKLAIFDIDDTLIERGEILIKPSAYQAIKTLEEKGVQVMIATGRAYYFIQDDVFQRVKPDYVVTINGSCVFNKERDHIVYITPTRQDVEAIIQICRQHNIGVAGKMLDEMHVYHGLETFLTSYLKGSPKEHILLDYQDAELGDEIPMGLFLMGDETFIETLRPVYPELKFAKAYRDAYDIYSVNAGKIKGIETVLGKLSLTWDEVIAFGDAENDQDMLRHAAIGVAMGNATDTLKEIADYVTTDIDDHGIYNALKHLNLI